MTRFAWLLPLSLGVFLACDGSDPSSPDNAADLAVSEVTAEAAVVIDVQPLGDFEKAAINTATGQAVTVAVVDYPGFFDAVDLGTVTFFGAAPIHLDRIEENPDCHITTVLLPDETTYLAHLLHFDLADLSSGLVNMCLEGAFLDGTTFSTCIDVTVQSKGGHGGQ